MIRARAVFVTNNAGSDLPYVVAPQINEIPSLYPATGYQFNLADAHLREVGLLCHQTGGGGERAWTMRHGFLRAVSDTNTEGWTFGTILWADDTGVPTMTPPAANRVKVKLGTVYLPIGDGTHNVFVDVRVYPPIGNLSGVDITTPTRNDVLIVRDVGGSQLGVQARPLRRSALYAFNFTVNEDEFLSRVDASAGPVTATLPPAVADTVLAIKKIDATLNRVTIDAVSNGSTIDGADTFDLVLQGESLTLQCNGTSWVVI